MMDGNHTPVDRVKASLRSSEQLLWVGEPDPDVRFTQFDRFFVPFSVLWAGFAVFWELAAISSGDPFFILFGIPFVAAAGYITVGRFVYKRRRKLGTAYGVTTERALVVADRSLRDTPIVGVPTTVRWTRDARHLDITFGTNSSRLGWPSYANTGMEVFDPTAEVFAFHDVADGHAVLDAIEQARRTGPGAAGAAG
jgi:hypothetical protein